MPPIVGKKAEIIVEAGGGDKKIHIADQLSLFPKSSPFIYGAKPISFRLPPSNSFL
jgi:hypothetical protein